MNVKKNSLLRSSRENSSKELNSIKTTNETKTKGKIGEEIRKKMKINNLSTNVTHAKQEKENISHNSTNKNIYSSKTKTSLTTLK